MSKETDTCISEKNSRPLSSQVYFYYELPQIATCHECVVLVPMPNITFKKKSKISILKRKKSEQTLHSFGSCTVLLLEYDSLEDIVNFSACENEVYICMQNTLALSA